MDFLELWKALHTKMKPKQLELVAVVMKRIWYRRNKFVFESRFEDPQQLYSVAKQVLE